MHTIKQIPAQHVNTALHINVGTILISMINKFLKYIFIVLYLSLDYLIIISVCSISY